MTQLSRATTKPRDLKQFAVDLWNNYYIVVAFVVMIIISVIVSPNFFSWVNITNVLRQSAVPGIVSLGMLVVILTAGIDLSVGSLVAITGVLAVAKATAFTPGLAGGPCGRAGRRRL
jgi:ribose transport system permease protein